MISRLRLSLNISLTAFPLRQIDKVEVIVSATLNIHYGRVTLFVLYSGYLTRRQFPSFSYYNNSPTEP